MVQNVFSDKYVNFIFEFQFGKCHLVPFFYLITSSSNETKLSPWANFDCTRFPNVAPVGDQYLLIDRWPWIFQPKLTEKDCRRGEERSGARREEADGMEVEMDGLPWMKKDKMRRESGASVRLWWMLMSQIFMHPILGVGVCYSLDSWASKYFN